MRRAIYWPLIFIGVFAAFHFLLTGSPVPLWIAEKLNNPSAVSSIGNDSITTMQGKIIDLRNAGLIRDHPMLLKDISRHGVEISPSGEVFGLIRVHHWCGNDPVRYHLARVSLASLVTLIEYDPGMRRIDPGSLGLLRLPPERLKEFFQNRRTPPAPQALVSKTGNDL